MTQSENTRGKNRLAATAVAGGLLLWVALGHLHPQRQIALEGEHQCVGLAGVEGDVKSPGIFLLKGLREAGTCTLSLVEIVDAAGGLKGGNRHRSPLSAGRAQRILAGQKVVVSLPDSGDASFHLEPLDGVTRLVWGDQLNVNEATRDELCLVPRMKPEFADAILERRGRSPWKNVDELSQIHGVGPKTVAKWKDYLSAGEGTRRNRPMVPPPREESLPPQP